MNKRSLKGNLLLLSSVLLILAIGQVTPQAFAVPGDPLATVNPTQCGTGGGIGVAFDGTNIWFTCNGAGGPRTTLFKTDLTSADLGGVPVVDASNNPLNVDAIAWDPTENKMWSTNLSGDVCHVYSIDMNSGVATPRFDYTGPNCDASFVDGLTVDTVTNTIYASDDATQLIRHFDKTGNPAANDPIDHLALTGFINSGLAIGIDGTLYTGTNGAGKIFAIDPNGPLNLGQFSSVSGRDEDLECGPQINGVETLLSRDFFSNSISVLEVAPKTCISPTVAVGGSILPIDTAALFIAGAFTNAIWIAPVLAGAAGTTAFYLKTRKN